MIPMRGLTLGVIADDLTGAIDTALSFFRQTGQATVLPLPCQATPETGFPSVNVLSLNADTRHEDIEGIVQKLDWSLKVLNTPAPVDLLYKKIDSTCRGRIAVECLHLVDKLGLDAAIVVPAYPQQGRQVVGGYVLLRGLPVELTEVARDPLAPVRQAYLPKLLAQGLPAEMDVVPLIDWVPLSVVLKGAGPLVASLNEMLEKGKRLIAIDAASPTDLEQIALALEKLKNRWQLLPCGSGGLAEALAEQWFPVSSQMDDDYTLSVRLPEIQLQEAPILIVAGSNMPMTRKQLRRLLEHPHWKNIAHLIALKPSHLLGLEPLDALQAQLQEALQQKETGHCPLVVVTSAWDEHTYEDTLALAREKGLSPTEALDTTLVPFSVQRQLLALVEPSFTVPNIQLVLCGGQTSQTITQALGVSQLKVLAEIEPNVALSQDEQGRCVVTKSGNFGDALTLIHVVDFLKHHQEKMM